MPRPAPAQDGGEGGRRPLEAYPQRQAAPSRVPRLLDRGAVRTVRRSDLGARRPAVGRDDVIPGMAGIEADQFSVPEGGRNRARRRAFDPDVRVDDGSAEAAAGQAAGDRLREARLELPIGAAAAPGRSGHRRADGVVREVELASLPTWAHRILELAVADIVPERVGEFGERPPARDGGLDLEAERRSDGARDLARVREEDRHSDRGRGDQQKPREVPGRAKKSSRAHRSPPAANPWPRTRLTAWSWSRPRIRSR